jgi:RNA polymerase sigma-70 factor, ECF subfamily
VTRTDGELQAAAARGDGAAFGCFYRRHERRVLAYAVGHCIGASDVADLVAETFLQALVSAGRFRSTDGDALPWLLGISRHMLARQRRSFVRRQRLLDRLSALPAFTPDEADAVDAAIDAARLAPALTMALNGLSAKDRELLLLVARDGLEPAQAGAVLGMTANAARVRLSRVRRRLHGVLTDQPAPGIELSIGYYHVAGGFGIHVTLVPGHAVLTCTASPPIPPHP